jgi:hypothetical protein
MRRAAVDIAGELVGCAAQVISDAGFRIVGSLPSPVWPAETVRLVIEGSGLPEECNEDELRHIRLQMIVEHYGSQRVTKVSGIELLERVQPA